MPSQWLPKEQGEADLLQLRDEDVLVTDGFGTGSVGVERRVNQVDPKFLTKTTVAMVFREKEVPEVVFQGHPVQDGLRIGDDTEQVPTRLYPPLDLRQRAVKQVPRREDVVEGEVVTHRVPPPVRTRADVTGVETVDPDLEISRARSRFLERLR